MLYSEYIKWLKCAKSNVSWFGKQYHSLHAAWAAFSVVCPTCGIQLPVTFLLGSLTGALVFLKCLGKGSFAAANLFQENNGNVALYKINMKGKCLAGLVWRVKVR